MVGGYSGEVSACVVRKSMMGCRADVGVAVDGYSVCSMYRNSVSAAGLEGEAPERESDVE